MDTIGLGNSILDNIVSLELQRALLPMKIIFLLISLVVIVLMIWLFKKSSYKDFLFMDWWNDYKLLKSIRAGELDEAEGDSEQKAEEVEVEVEAKAEVQAPVEDIAQSQKQPQPQPQQQVETSDWQRIVDKLETKNELKCKLALLDANRLLDKNLREKGKSLKDLSNFEKIEKIKDYLERLLDHPNKGITFRNANNIIREYKIALKEIGAI